MFPTKNNKIYYGSFKIGYLVKTFITTYSLEILESVLSYNKFLNKLCILKI